MDVPLSVCESRDPKGLYKLARAGKIKGKYRNTYYYSIWPFIVIDFDLLTLELGTEKQSVMHNLFFFFLKGLSDLVLKLLLEL